MQANAAAPRGVARDAEGGAGPKGKLIAASLTGTLGAGGQE
jgi:hypothetical protein